MDLINAYSDSSPSTSPANSQPSSPSHNVKLPALDSVDVPISLTAPAPETAIASEPVSAITPAPVKLVTGTIEEISFDESQFSVLERTLAATGTSVDPATGALVRPHLPKVYVNNESIANVTSPHRKRTTSAATAGSTDASQGDGAKSSKRPRGAAARVPLVPTSQLHVSTPQDYQRRSWAAAPSTARTFEDLETYTPFIPKRCTHDMNAHSRGVSKVQFSPPFGHLLLTAGLDGAAHVWNADNAICLRSYNGHAKGICDATFNPSSSAFLTAGYDRAIRLWDTETGRILGSFKTSGIPYCVKFSPPHNGVEFLAGCGDKKAIQIDIRDASKIVQQYDQHMGAVNSISFIDDDRRFVSSSDDKVLRLWDYGVPVVIRHVSDPTAHSMPFTLLHPNRKSLACQSMDNTVRIFTARDKLKPNAKKTFKGHLVAGYACGLQTSSDGRFLASGDSLGRLFFWDWRTTRVFRALEAHKGVCIGIDWHPTRPSLVASCGWDGKVKLWD